MVLAIYNRLSLLNKIVQQKNISIILKVKCISFTWPKATGQRSELLEYRSYRPKFDTLYNCNIEYKIGTIL